MIMETICISSGRTKVFIHLLNEFQTNNLFQLLPLPIIFEDFFTVGKMAYIKEKIIFDHASKFEIVTPEVGDVMYYEPWNSLVIFHKTYRYMSGLIKIGKVIQGLETIEKLSEEKVTLLKKGSAEAFYS